MSRTEATGQSATAGAAPTGAAGGDLTGTYPNPTIGSGKVTSAMIADGTIVNADVNASAAIAYSKLNLASSIVSGDIVDGTIVNADIGSSAAIGIAKLADPTTGKVIGSASSAAAAVYPPGYEIAYSQITSNVNVTSTTESSGTTIISPGAVTFDGAPVLCHFQAENVVIPSATSTGNFVIVSLFESTTQITRLATVALVDLLTGQQMNIPVAAFFRFTPTAGAHTYTITAHTSSTTGTPAVNAASGGTGANCPAFVRFTKV